MNTLYTARLYMMNAIRILFAALLPIAVFGQAPAPFPVTIDSQRGTAPALEVFQANEITFRLSYKSGGVANNITTETPFMYWQPYGATNATVVTGNYSIVTAASGVVDFAFAPSDLNFTAGIYTYQAGLEQSGGPLVLKQGAFTIKPSAASIGAEPVIFATTNINWSNINWVGVPDWDLITNVNAKLTTLSNNLQTAIDSVDGGQTWSGRPATQDVNFAQYYATNLGGIDFDLTPSGSIAPGRMQWNPDMETVRLGLDAAVSLDVGQQQVAFVRNAESVTISNGTVVYISGATGDKATVKVASYSNDTLSARTIGIAAEDIVSGGTGFVVTRGPVYAQKTDTFTQGAMLYLGAYGNVTTNRPQAPLHGVFVGVVEKVNANAGVIYVAVQNGFEMDELHDVNVSGVTSGQILKYNGAVWTNAAETDPVWAAASNSIDTRITANTTGKVALTTYTPATQALWAAIGGIVGAENALTNVTGDSRITATRTGANVALAFDATGLATGTPIYSVAGLATGTPLYTFTELDPTAITNVTASGRLTATKTDKQVALTFDGTGLATGTPVYSLSGYLTSTGAAATYLPLAGGTMTGPLNMNDQLLQGTAGKEIDFDSGAFAGTWSFGSQPTIVGYLTSTGAAAIYLPLNGGAVTGSITMSGKTNIVITNTFSDGNAIQATMTGTAGYEGLLINDNGSAGGSYLVFKRNGTNEYTFDNSLANFHGNKITNAVVDGYLTSTGAVATYLGITAFNASSNAINTRLVSVEGYTNRAASALSSSVWASADSTTNYMYRTGGYMSGGLTFTNSRITVLGQSTADGLYLGKAGNTAADSKKIELVTSSALGVDNTKYIQATYTDDRLKFHSQGTTHTLGYLSEINTATTRIGAAETRITAVEGYTNRAALALASNVWVAADSTTNYASRITFNATSNKFNTAILFLQTNVVYSNSLPAQLVTTNNLSTIAGSGLGVTGNQLVVTNVAGTVTTNDLANYLPLTGGTMTGGISMPGYSIVLDTIEDTGSVKIIDFTDGGIYGPWEFSEKPTIPGYVQSNTLSSYVTITAGNTNYARRTTVPASNTAFGSYNQWALDNTNLYFYNSASSKWLKVNGTLEW